MGRFKEEIGGRLEVSVFSCFGSEHGVLSDVGFGRLDVIAAFAPLFGGMSGCPPGALSFRRLRGPS